MQYNTEYLKNINTNISENTFSAKSIYGYFISLGNTETKTKDNVNYFGQTNYFEGDRRDLWKHNVKK